MYPQITTGWVKESIYFLARNVYEISPRCKENEWKLNTSALKTIVIILIYLYSIA